MESTKKYSIFNKHDGNRVLVEKNVKALMKSISCENLLHLRPILVDKDMNIIDGQHRLEAAKRLGLEIFYQIEESIDDSAIYLLNNNQLKWSSIDYLNYYCAQGNPHYLKMRNFMQKSNVTLSIAFSLLGPAQSGRYLNEFKGGKFTYPHFEDELDALTKIGQFKEMVDFIYPKILGIKKYLQGPNFCRAFVVFLNVKEVQFDVFMKKLAFKLDLIRPCARLKDFLDIFRSIYNYKNSNPLKPSDIEDLT